MIMLLSLLNLYSSHSLTSHHVIHGESELFGFLNLRRGKNVVEQCTAVLLPPEGSEQCRTTKAEIAERAMH